MLETRLFSLSVVADAAVAYLSNGDCPVGALWPSSLSLVYSNASARSSPRPRSCRERLERIPLDVNQA